MQANDGLDANQRWISDITRISSPRWSRRIQDQQAVIETAMLNEKVRTKDLQIQKMEKETSKLGKTRKRWILLNSCLKISWKWVNMMRRQSLKLYISANIETWDGRSISKTSVVVI
ncbi:hypothetical protein HID58_014884 [Brassica napus]|uniref:Uncharacterized protein n=1 Tax=Brassica napus TaxID=3708 RepID=A0ABQ8DIE3_BRANA|nr:hypothetical protein HID58_014884 [Brassica napus]